jgi:hypothetical protein
MNVWNLPVEWNNEWLNMAHSEMIEKNLEWTNKYVSKRNYRKEWMNKWVEHSKWNFRKKWMNEWMKERVNE